MEYSMEWLSNEVCEDFANVGISCTNPVVSSRMYHPTPTTQSYDCDKSLYHGMTYLDNSGQLPGPHQRAAEHLHQVHHTNGNIAPAAHHDHGPGGLSNKHGGLHEGHINGAIRNGTSSCPDNSVINGNVYPDNWEIGNRAKKICMDVKPEIEESNMEAADSTAEISAMRKREQKRRPKPKDGTVLICQICGDRALGYNFDAITCESCKAFFRRNALKTKVFTCSFEGNCKLDPHTRKFCSGCRLKKCVDVGMKKEWILSDEQLAKRRKKSCQTSDDCGQFHSPTQIMPPHLTSSNSPLSYCPPHKMELYSPPSSSSDGEINSTNYLADSTDTNSSVSSPPKTPYLSFSPLMVKAEQVEDDYPRPMPPDILEQVQLIEKEYKGVFDSGYSDDQAKKMVEKPHNANDLFNMTDIFIRRLIKFAKHIPEFKTLKQEDQIYLLKGGIMEIMVLRSAMGFDPDNLKWNVKTQQNATEHKLDPSIIKEQLGTAMYTEHIKFVKGLHQLTNSDRTVMTLLFVIEIFTPDRTNLRNIDGVAFAQEKYTKWLKTYLESIMPPTKADRLCKDLLMKLLEVRNLGESSAQLASNLDITKLEPLLIEVFNLQK